MHITRLFGIGLVSVMSVIFLSACHRDKVVEQGISFQEVKEYIDPVKQTYKQPDWAFINCHEPSDSLAYNQPYTYDEAVSVLKRMFVSIDRKQISMRGKQYCKALICADFVYAAFSYHYFGDDDGFAGDTVLNPGWDLLALNVCYNIGNSNCKALYCYERSSFYLRLVKALTGLNGKVLNKDNVHSFPIIFITDQYGNAQPYLIDPYDPFVVVSRGGVIQAFKQSLNLPEQVEIYRTRRLFGQTRLLISKKMVSNLTLHGLLPQFCSIPAFTKNLVEDYVRSHPGADSSVIDLPSFSHSHIVINNSRYEYAIETNGRPEGEFFASQHYLKYYWR